MFYVLYYKVTDFDDKKVYYFTIILDASFVIKFFNIIANDIAIVIPIKIYIHYCSIPNEISPELIR